MNESSQKKGTRLAGSTGTKIQLFGKSLLSAYYTSSTVLATPSMTGSKRDMSAALMELAFIPRSVH